MQVGSSVSVQGSLVMRTCPLSDAFVMVMVGTCPCYLDVIASYHITSSYIPLVGESHGTSGQCVSFSLIDAGSVLLLAFFFSFLHKVEARSHCITTQTA